MLPRRIGQRIAAKIQRDGLAICNGDAFRHIIQQHNGFAVGVVHRFLDRAVFRAVYRRHIARSKAHRRQHHARNRQAKRHGKPFFRMLFHAFFPPL